MGEGHSIEDNYRPLQAIGNRYIYTNDESAQRDLGSSAASLSTLSALALAVSTAVARLLH